MPIACNARDSAGDQNAFDLSDARARSCVRTCCADLRQEQGIIVAAMLIGQTLAVSPFSRHYHGFPGRGLLPEA